MATDNISCENIFKTADESIRRKVIVDKVTKLIEKDILSSVRFEAVACLQSREK